MKFQCLIIVLHVTLIQASIFDFFQQHEQQNQQRVENEEVQKLSLNCNSYVCPDTGTCVKEPKLCPCPFPSSQLRCNLPNSDYICISKPAGIYGHYDDPGTNWKVDAQDDNIRDCGWVARILKS